MPDKPPLHKQETNYSCAPACLRMVLESYGIIESEEALRDLCDCIFDGTDSLRLVDAAKRLSFTASQRCTLTPEQLKEELERQIHPIVYVKTRLSPNTPFQLHAVVLTEMTEEAIEVLDPWRGEYIYLREDFLREWAGARHETVLIEKS